MKSGRRLEYLDMVKGIGIFFVVLGHMEDIATGTRVWISSFHMPLFFIVSGILMAVKDEPSNDLKESVKKRFRGTIIPYLWFSLSYFVIDIGNLNVVHNIDLRTFITDTIDSLTFYGMSVLWFLPALFLASTGFLFLKKKFGDQTVAVLLIVIAVTAYSLKYFLFSKIWSRYENSIAVTSLINIVYIFLRAAVAQSFVGYGYYAKKLYDGFAASGGKLSLIISGKAGSLITGAILLAVNVALAMYNGCADLRNIILNNVAVYYIAAFAGCFGIILMFKAIPAVKPVTYFGRNSIIVMACHVNYYFLYAGIRLGWLVDSFNRRARHYVFVAVVIVTVFALSAITIEIINRFFPFVLGKKRIPKTGV
ncbi:MAG: acyltransferase [Eubacterium sp.]|nr:acyltransferase [Eubacterium sp.]